MPTTFRYCHYKFSVWSVVTLHALRPSGNTVGFFSIWGIHMPSISIPGSYCEMCLVWYKHTLHIQYKYTHPHVHVIMTIHLFDCFCFIKPRRQTYNDKIQELKKTVLHVWSMFEFPTLYISSTILHTVPYQAIYNVHTDFFTVSAC